MRPLRRAPRLRASSREGSSERAVITAVAALAAHVASGLEPVDALARIRRRLTAEGEGEAGREMTEFAGVLDRAAAAHALGSSPASVFLRATTTAASPALARVYGELHMCFHLSARAGLPLEDLLEAMADAGQARLDAEERVRAALAGPEATARMLLWLPAVGAALGALMTGQSWWETVTSGLGLGAVTAGAVLILAGRAWSAAILQRARRVEVAW